jgi:hypothetical protein
MDINKWKLLHTYYSLAEHGPLKPIVCPDCDQIVVPIIDADSDEPIPALFCLYCDVITRPGLDFWDQVSQMVFEYYEPEVLQ